VAFLFEKLEVYEKALELVEEVHSATDISSQGYGHIVSQLRRAATSIPLNIAEGFGRFNEGEKRRFYQIARASCYECVAALDLCHRCRVIDEDVFSSMKSRSDEVGRMLTGLIKAVERRAQATGSGKPQT